jgi:hypothetical protein
MDKLVACLAQHQESILSKVVIVRCVHMVDVQVAQTFVLHATVLAGHIPGCRKEPPEQLPGRTLTELGSLFCIRDFHIDIYRF